MTKNNRIFIDTNILISCYDEKRKRHEIAFNFIEKSMNGEYDAYVSVQILNEFARNLMNPVKTSKPLDNETVSELLEEIYGSAIKILPVSFEGHKRLLKLNSKYNLYGAKFFDLLIVATMLENDIKTIVTENVDDFEDFKEIKILSI
ncbi:MAG TPA: PIN domain-containing protein [Candidatus Wallbacteria bacterium]|nr:MAG: tRNA(fMet)-specific endonuclease VapC [bacterium ADurb.Bin243]HOD39860.1 PIN domain-containing protein [Candidatus Wallbacteria bacterium]HPG59599.1 PIN domain-containing protein [Candidatus Wallbacteria bacterium]